MNDHNLDDLIIDTPSQKSGKAKSILTIIALLIVVMIAAIVLTKIILKNPDAQPAVLEESDIEVVSPELTLQYAVQEEQNEEEETLTDMTEDEVETPEEEPVKQQTISVEETEAHTVTPVRQKSHTSQAKEKVAVPQTITPPTHTTKPVHTPKQKVKKPVHKPKPKPKPKPTPKPVAKGTYYIQVGSFSKAPAPNSRLITAIRKQGFKHRIFTVNGMKKVMVGPYSSRVSADQAIVKIKDLINKSAFVVKK